MSPAWKKWLLLVVVGLVMGSIVGGIFARIIWFALSFVFEVDPEAPINWISVAGGYYAGIAVEQSWDEMPGKGLLAVSVMHGIGLFLAGGLYSVILLFVVGLFLDGDSDAPINWISVAGGYFAGFAVGKSVDSSY